MSNKNEKRKWYVYVHTTPNNKTYVGITGENTPECRWKKGHGYRGNSHFWNAIQLYGWDNIKHEVIAKNLTKKEACELEKKLIAKYNSSDRDFGYNSSTGGEFPAEGFHHTEESKKKISEAFTGRFVGELNPMYGVHDNHICDKDGHLPEYIRKKLSIAAKNRMKNDKKWANQMQQYNEERKRPVNQYDLEGNFIRQYESLCSLLEYFPNMTTIWKVCNRHVDKKGSHIYTAYGFQWRYSDDCDDITSIKHTVVRYGKRRVAQYDLEGNLIAIYDSVADASKITGIGYIYGAASGRRKTAGGYIWRYYEEVKDELDNIAV